MTVVVVGGGITGLVAARALAAAGEQVIMVEASERLGGKIVTHEIGGALVEGGPDWFITRAPEAVELCRSLGIAGDLVSPSGSGALIARSGKLRRLPRDFVRGVPPSMQAALRSRLLSPAGAIRALGDYVLPGPLSGADVSVGALVRRRFGNEVLERLVEPMIAASRSGAPDEIGLAAGAPELDAAARSSRSVMRGLRRRRGEPPMLPPFLGIRGGMQRLVDALAADLGTAHVMLGAPVTTIAPAETGWNVHLDSGDTLDARAVVVTAPAPAAARILADAAPTAAERLAAIPYEPAAVVALAYPAGSVPVPDGATGVLVPAAERRAVTACAWFSSKWPHTSPPDGPDVVRAFAGGPAALGDEDVLVGDVSAEVASLTGAPPAPDAAVVTRWEHALPVLGVGHHELVATVEESLPPGIVVAGAGLQGSGLPDCIRSGAAAAVAVVAQGER